MATGRRGGSARGGRRWTGRVLGAFALVTVSTGLALAGEAGGGWDATWFGGFADGGDGVQIIVTGGKVIGFFYHGDYLDTDDGTQAADGSIAFHWDGGEGTLREAGGGRALAIHEQGKADRVIPLERDE